jgi:5-methylcytosine-specific restriction endonuclease McrA
MLFEGNAQVVHSDEGNFNTFNFNEWADFSEREPELDCINGVSIKLRLPRVVLLMVYDRMPKKEVKFTRYNIFQRDKNTCQYCGEKFDCRDLNLDHVIPRQHNGPTSWENIVCSCIPCNSKKSNKTPAQAGMNLIRQPKKPHWHPFMQVRFSMQYHESWRHFLDLAYWNVELGEDLQ